MKHSGGALDNCPECGHPMAPTLDGPPFCPACGYQDSFHNLPALGPEDAGSTDEMGHTLLYDADMLGEDVAGPALTPRNQPTVQATPKKGEPVVAPRKQSPSAVGLRLPRCVHCERPLELEEVSAGACIVCQSMSAEDDSGSGVAFGRVIEIAVGLLASSLVIWVVILAVARAQTTGGYEKASFIAGLLLAAFALLAGIGFSMGGRWASGAGLALGLPAAAIAAVFVASDEPARDPILWWTWLSAGVTGTLVSVAALTCFRVPRDEPTEPPEVPGRRVRRIPSRTGTGHKTSSVFAGCVVLGAAAAASWFAYLAFTGGYRVDAAYSAASRDAFIIGGASLTLSALCLAGLGIWLIRRPSVVPPMCSMIAGSLAGALPAWMLAAAIASGWNASRPLALVSGVGDMVAVEWLAALPRAATPETFALSVSALLISGIFALLGIFTREPRGAALSGYALAWSLIWAAGIIAGGA